MLVLSRKRGQGLLIDGTTVIRVLEIRGQQIRLGIEAPETVSVLRTELQTAVADVPSPNDSGGNSGYGNAVAARRSHKSR
jgi:carbon storage regulator